MNKYRVFPAMLLLSVLMVTQLAWSAADKSHNVQDIVRKTEQVAYYQGQDGQARVTMKIIDAKGRERRRVMSILRADGEAENTAQGTLTQKYYVYLHYPSDVKDTVLMVWKNGTSDDDRWLYLPALDLVKRIAAGDKRTSFLGSDFFYEDISGRNMDEDSHELVEVTDNYYVVRNTPKDPDGVEFSRFEMWIHRGSHLPVKVEFFDRQDTRYRVYEALKVEQIQGNPTVVESRMRDLRTNTETTLEFSKVKYDMGIPDSVFTERHLRNPPRQYLR